MNNSVITKSKKLQLVALASIGAMLLAFTTGQNNAHEAHAAGLNTMSAQQVGKSIPVVSDVFTAPKTCLALASMPVIRSHRCKDEQCPWLGSTLRYETASTEIWLTADYKAFWVGVVIPNQSVSFGAKTTSEANLDLTTGAEY